MCLKENNQMKQILFSEITHLIRYWSKNRYNHDYKSYSYLIQEFWKNLNILFASLVDSSENSEIFDISDTNNSQIEFLITLKTAPMHTRKNLKVKFCNTEENIIIQSQIQNIENDADTEFLSELNNFVNCLCVKYFNQITEKREKKYIAYLNKLIICFESDELFKNLSEFLKTHINFLNFCNEILRDWLLEQSKETEHIIELIFNLMKYMNYSERNEILKSLTEVNIFLYIKNIYLIIYFYFYF